LCGKNNGALQNVANPNDFYASRPNGFGAWDFDGANDYIDLGGTRSDLNLSDYTVTAWFKMGVSTGWRTFFGDWNSGRTCHFGLMHDGRTITNYVHLNGTQYQVAGTLLTDAVWYHVATTMQIGGDFQLYVDGMHDATTSISGTTGYTDTTPSSVFTIGQKWAGGGNPFDGFVDDVRIYDRELSPQEVRQLYLESRNRFTRTLNWITTDQESPAITHTAPVVNAGGAAARGSVVNPSQPINLAHPLNRGLVSCWKVLQGSTGLVVRDLVSENRNHLTWQTAGRAIGSSRGRVLDFDRASEEYLTADNSASLDITEQITMSLWFWTSHNTGYKHLIVKPANATWSNPWARYMLRIDTLGQWLLMQINSPYTYAAAAAAPLSQWNLGTATYDGATMRVYVNGSEGGSTAYVSSIPTSAHPLYIGAISTAGYSFDGQMDDVRIYDRALSASEVMQLYLETRQRYSPLFNQMTIPVASAVAAGGPWPHHIDNYDLSGNFSGLGV